MIILWPPTISLVVLVASGVEAGRRAGSEEYDDGYDEYEDRPGRPDGFGGFARERLDSSERFGGFEPKRRQAPFDEWASGEEDDFKDFPDFKSSDFKDFPDEPRERSGIGGHRSHVSVQSGHPENPVSTQYSISHPNRSGRKADDYDEFFSGEESEPPRRPFPSFKGKRDKKGPSDFAKRSGPLFRPTPPDGFFEKDYSPEPSLGPAADYTSNVHKKIKVDMEPFVASGDCLKSKKSAGSGEEGKGKMMTCYKCYDEGRVKSFERCKYESEPSTERFEYDSGQRRAPTNSHKHRVRRQVYDDNPSFFGSSYSDSDFYRGEFGPDEDYRFSPDFFVDDTDRAGDHDEDEVTSSDNGERCKRSRKDNMLCISCVNPKTHGSYEQCSYASEPQEESYEYSRNSAYGSPRGRHKRSTNRSDSSNAAIKGFQALFPNLAQPREVNALAEPMAVAAATSKRASSVPSPSKSGSFLNSTTNDATPTATAESSTTTARGRRAAGSDRKFDDWYDDVPDEYDEPDEYDYDVPQGPDLP